MTHTIKAGGAFSSHFLEVTFFGVRYQPEDAAGYEAQRYRFEEIDCVLMSAGHVLSFQANNQVFSIQTKPGDPAHTAAVSALVEGLRRAAGADANPVRAQ